MALSLLACGEPDKTAEKACENAACPVGTTIRLDAHSINQCQGAASVNIVTESGEAQGQCFAEGSCVYVCVPPRPCCRGELWTVASYRCEAPCCPDGTPSPCSGGCGDGVCSAGETPTTCPGDCGDTCGDGACTGTESPASCPGDCQ